MRILNMDKTIKNLFDSEDLKKRRLENIIKMNRTKGQLKRLGVVVKKSIYVNVTGLANLSVAMTFGIAQGLKYNGSLVRGIKTGVAILGALTVVGVIHNVGQNMDYIKGKQITKPINVKKRYS